MSRSYLAIVQVDLHDEDPRKPTGFSHLRDLAERIETGVADALAPFNHDQIVTYVSPHKYRLREYCSENITPLSVLFFGLPFDDRSPETLDALSAHYYRELQQMQDTVNDPLCREPAMFLSNWRTAGDQMICEFGSLDKYVYSLASAHYTSNFHGQDTTAWRNPETRWQGHQGAIVFDRRDKRVTSHH